MINKVKANELFLQDKDVKEDYFTPKRQSFNEVTKTALDYLLSQISTIPKYITTALLDGLYYRLDIP